MFRKLIVEMVRGKMRLDQRLHDAFEERAARAEGRRIEVEQQIREDGWVELTCPEREQW
jgi:hypothetical protein